MALVYAYQPLDMNGWNLHAMYDDGDARYDDVLIRVLYDGDKRLADFYGHGITGNEAAGTLTGGTIDGYLEQALVEGRWHTGWEMNSTAPVSAVSIYNAIVSAGTEDDAAVLRQALSLDDRLDLSGGADIAAGYDGSDRLHGMAGNDRLDGGSGNDTLEGGAGNDTLFGGAGRDSLTGGSGSDWLSGGAGNDIYVVNSALDRVSETSTLATEIDTVKSSVSWSLDSNFERILLVGSAALDAAGNTAANGLTGNEAANVLRGDAGNDALIGNGGNDTLNGGTGRDILQGGRGNDTYVVDDSGDRIEETLGSSDGIDHVYSSASSGLSFGVERLVLMGSASIHGTGNELANVIVGNGAANVLDGDYGNDALSGGAGNDWLIGGEGFDVLTGGAGMDAFRFSGAEYWRDGSVDRITDFAAADDRIDLDDAVFFGLGPVGALGLDAFRLGAAALDWNDRIIYHRPTGQLFYDSDGIHNGEAKLIATLTPGTTLALGDLFVV